MFWARIDGVAVNAAKSQLSVRRIIEIEGPYGLGAKSVPGSDAPTGDEKKFHGATAQVYGATPLPLGYVLSKFFVSGRDIAAYEKTGVAFDASAIATAAIATAQQEDGLLLYGSKALGLTGLLNTKGTQKYKIAGWEKVAKAASDVMGAATQLDKAGFHGPYALALAPDLYNGLFAFNADGRMTGYEHIRQFVTGGIVKAPAVESGGVLIAVGTQYASIAVGQDFQVGFIGPVEAGYELSISESVALRLRQPAAVTVLQGA